MIHHQVRASEVSRQSNVRPRLHVCGEFPHQFWRGAGEAEDRLIRVAHEKDFRSSVPKHSEQQGRLRFCRILKLVNDVPGEAAHPEAELKHQVFIEQLKRTIFEKSGQVLTAEQQHFYEKKFADLDEEVFQFYPTEREEAFLHSGRPVIHASKVELSLL